MRKLSKLSSAKATRYQHFAKGGKCASPRPFTPEAVTGVLDYRGYSSGRSKRPLVETKNIKPGPWTTAKQPPSPPCKASIKNAEQVGMLHSRSRYATQRKRVREQTSHPGLPSFPGQDIRATSALASHPFPV
eukprot:1159352-Pelagomonas_calceolata.AAC.3